MFKPKGFEKPTGVRDYLPYAVKKLRQIERNVLECMDRWGYQQIMTPTMEYYDTVGVASSTSDQKLFKLLNNRGTTMVLRSDMTAPIARVASSLLKEQPLPIRLSYHANVFRSIEEEAGREAEFFQTGVELLGDDSAEADAEVVALAIESLKAAGVSSFKIAMGHVGFLHGLLEEVVPDRADAQELLKDGLLRRDYVGFRNTISELDLSETERNVLSGLVRLRGGKDTCDQALQLSGHPQARASIDHLCKVWEVLEAYGVSEHVLIDLTMIGDFSYYTGMTFEGYASELGFPVCNGGRYDNLLQQFGRPIPATGFALKTNRILDGVNVIQEEEIQPILIQYDAARRQEGLQEAIRLRNEGYTVITEWVQSNSPSANTPKVTEYREVKTYLANH
ncbi:ATP phosphoribosyltransferase regulatory subunit [Paenibacillus crassostreae]|uniref:ATP phosphoribosyltransferase regulatory subunit n=1 Tax=Paenibacillus crassostreae TaxID=1763538 RepID=A0A167GEY7_9BACL|nr:ATP phosphoribosyltransferase regulatory subunit [Paenibacillus crassostreae]AOZ92739.1 ATP phosphoribosyltransferase regulatory subunit [Paenibacillus crassostreae]OAB77511.1 ATP phosphoribosyltransferase regulatory subunit [Paenibacillus crassostreae]